MFCIVVWWWLEPTRGSPTTLGSVSGYAYSPFGRLDSPIAGRFPSADQIAADMAILAPSGRAIRTYSSSDVAIPVAANAHGIEVFLGVWLSRDRQRNERELMSALQAAREQRNVKALVIGNETLLRNDQSLQELRRMLRRAKDASDVPITTAEFWDIWIRHPELANDVDFITVHLLPYWQGIPVTEALAHARDSYRKVQAAFPGRRVVVGEVGWPSFGSANGPAVPSIENQARFLRQWVAYAERANIEYFIIEAFDQPWKTNQEGAVGGAWGVYDASREPKFQLLGDAWGTWGWWQSPALSFALALPLLWFLGARRTPISFAGRIVFALAIQATVLSWIAIGCFAQDAHFQSLDVIAFAALVPAHFLLSVIVLSGLLEWIEVRFRTRWPAPPIKHNQLIDFFVSIHVPCHDESPDQVIATLDSLSRLEFEGFEVIVIDNNTSLPERWQPIQAHCNVLGERFKFVHVEGLQGYKAGALNLALKHTDSQANLIAIVDSDYVVDPSWLKTVVAYLGSPQVAVVQCPQAHRTDGSVRFCDWMRTEYDGFFRIGMHLRHDRDAIVLQGTMTVIRREALVAVGAWSESCIVEDAELGLRLSKAGYALCYLDEVLGSGLTPIDFSAYRAQRQRWAYGAVQVLKRHWRELLGPGALTIQQRYHYLTGWMPWLADGLHLAFALMALAWTLGALFLPGSISLPLSVLLLPTFVLLFVRSVLAIDAHRVRVRATPALTAGAAIAAMSLTHGTGKAVWRSILEREMGFLRTQRSPRANERSLASVREELGLLIALLLGALAITLNEVGAVQARNWWVALLVAMSLPYAAAGMVAVLDGRQKRRSRV